MKPEIINGFKFQKDIDGSKKLIIESSKLDECIKYVLDGNIKSITINYFQGYELPDIDFLYKLSNVLEGLHLPETKFDIKVLNSLHNLKYLGFADNKKDVVDLSSFPNLESLACDHSSRLRGLDTCKKLKSLALTGYKSQSKGLSELPSFSVLQELYLFKADIANLQGVERYGTLKKIALFGASKLETVAALKPLYDSLEEIQIEQCKKINDFEIIGKIKSLKKIILSESGAIKSLVFLEELPRLEFISFWGTNVLDGEIKYCEGISYVGFDNKKHYTHKSEQFKK
ncbi:MAG TPA: hypothetical protein VF677_05425 [Flavobacterium sp.]|jgi:hypothetical protein